MVQTRPLLKTGGAVGCDSIFIDCALKAGHSIEVNLFRGMRYNTPQKAFNKPSFKRITHSDQELENIKYHWRLAGSRLGRKLTETYQWNKFTQRDFFNVEKVDVVYAVGMKNDHYAVPKEENVVTGYIPPLGSVMIDGGTGFTCQYFVDFHWRKLIKQTENQSPEERLELDYYEVPLYFYDLNSSTWNQPLLNRCSTQIKWERLSKPPPQIPLNMPMVYSGVGTRMMPQNKAHIIESLFVQRSRWK